MGLIHRLYRAEVKHFCVRNGIRLEPGMSVEFQCPNMHHPLWTEEGRQAIEDAFMRRYGISIRRADALNYLWIKCEAIN